MLFKYPNQTFTKFYYASLVNAPSYKKSLKKIALSECFCVLVQCFKANKQTTE